MTLKEEPRGKAASAPLLVVLHGVNLNLLGERPSVHYGSFTLSELEDLVRQAAEARGYSTVFAQTNHEGEFVELVHRYRKEAAAFLVNPGAWTHYSYAIRDALELVKGPIAEVHLSQIEEREEWRRVSVIAEIARVRVMGKGPEGYVEAVDRLAAVARAEKHVQEEMDERAE